MTKQFKAPKSIKFLGYPLRLDFESDLFPRNFIYVGPASKDCVMTVRILRDRRWDVEVEVMYSKGAKAVPYYLAFAKGSTFREAVGNAQKDARTYIKQLLGLVTHDPRPSLNKYLYGH